MATTPWVPPALAVTGTTESSSDYNDLVNDTKLLGNPPFAYIANSGTFSLANNSTTADAAFDSTIIDTDGFYNGVTHPTRLTIPANLGGWYEIQALIGMPANATGVRSLGYAISGGTTFVLTNTIGSAAIAPWLDAAWTEQLAPGDYVTMRLYQNTGAGMTIATGAARFSIRWVSN